MRFWVIKTGEPLPITPGPAQRLLRAGTLARMLAERGHDVTWWASTFQHHTRTHVSDTDARIPLEGGVTLALVRGHGYQRTISFDRLREHQVVAEGFTRNALQVDPPDLILSSLPMIEVCEAAVRFGLPRGIPVVIDVRDLHPDIFQVGLPRLLRPAGGLILGKMRRRTRYACAKAAAITGITDTFVDWGLGYAGRARGAWDRAFPFGYTAALPPPEAVAEAEAFWDANGVRADPSAFRAVFVGALSASLEVEGVLRAARRLRDAGVQFVIAGDGDRLPELRAQYADCPNVVFPGWVGRAQIHVLLRRVSIGLNPMPDRFDFRGTINNKAVEYMCAGLPSIGSPDRGVLHDLLARTGAGATYAAGDDAKLAALLLQWRDHAGMRVAAGEAAAGTYRQRFVAEKVYAEMAAHLEALAADWAPRRNRRAAPASAGTAP